MNDMLDLRSADIFSSPQDIADWPITTSISKVTMRPSGDKQAGLAIEFDAQSRWPNYTPPGWAGPLQYTVWAMVKVGAQWAAAGFIQMWQGRPSTGAPILTDFHQNWAYSTRWGLLNEYFPKAGDLMGFMVTAGNARDEGGVTSVRERSNVVAITLPTGDNGEFMFQTGGTVEPPKPVPVPVPGPNQPPTPTIDHATLDDLHADNIAIIKSNSDILAALADLSNAISHIQDCRFEKFSLQGKVPYLGTIKLDPK